MSTPPPPPPLKPPQLICARSVPSLSVTAVTCQSAPVAQTHSSNESALGRIQALAKSKNPLLVIKNSGASTSSALSNFTQLALGKSQQISQIAAEQGSRVGHEIGKKLSPWLRRCSSHDEDDWKEIKAAAVAAADAERKVRKSAAIPMDYRASSNSSAVFGIPLADAVMISSLSGHHGPVPTVVVRCIEYLDVIALKEIGLYRIPGSWKSINALRAIFDDGNDYDFYENQTAPHEVATLLKDYLRKLPEPLFPYEANIQFNAALPKECNLDQLDLTASDDLVLSKMQSVAVRHLPVQNFFLLRILMAHLNRLAKNVALNKMSLSNLGLIFCPTLGIGSSLFGWLVRGWEVIFDDTKRRSVSMDLPIITSGSGGRIMSVLSISDEELTAVLTRSASPPPVGIGGLSPALPPRPKPPLGKKPPVNAKYLTMKDYRSAPASPLMQQQRKEISPPSTDLFNDLSIPVPMANKAEPAAISILSSSFRSKFPEITPDMVAAVQGGLDTGSAQLVGVDMTDQGSGTPKMGVLTIINSRHRGGVSNMMNGDGGGGGGKNN